MTLLNFCITEDRLFVMSDTVVSTQEKGPSFFTSKVHWLPHLNGLVCGTGSLDFILAWINHVQSCMLARDIYHLDEYATESLLDLADIMVDQFLTGGTTTIYHFGYDTLARKFGGFAYRSKEGFRSEPIISGIGTKPGIELRDDDEKTWPDYFIEIAKLQKAADDALPLNDRVGIGGHLVSYILAVDRAATSDSIFCNTSRVHEFADFESIYDACSNQLGERS